MTTTDVEDRLRAVLMAKELELLRGRDSIVIDVEPFNAFRLIAALQLAYRHPDLDDHLREVIETFGRQLQAAFLGPDTPQTALTLEQGWRREFDR